MAARQPLRNTHVLGLSRKSCHDGINAVARSICAAPSGTQPDPSTDAAKRPTKETLSQSMMFNLVIPVLLLCGGLAVVLMLGSVEPENRPADDTTRVGRLRALPPVLVEQLRSLESTGEQLRLEVDGVVVPFREARVAAEVAGRVVFKADECEAGSYVMKDQLLMRIDPTDYELEVQRLSRLQEQEYQALSEVDQEMVNSKRLIDLAQQDVQLQQQEVDRLKALPDGFTSRAEVDQANRARLAATQQLVTVENQLDLLRKRRVRLEASERLAATQLKAAEVNLKRTEIKAPIEGVIASEDADLNNFVARGSTLVTIEDTSKVEVATSLRMDQLHWVLDQKGRDLDGSARGYDLPETPAIIEYDLVGRQDSAYRWRGRLLSYDGIGLDSVTRTVPVRVLVDNPQEYVDEDGQTKRVSGATALVRGMYVHVHLLIKPQTQLVVIPARALQPGNRVMQFVPDESVLQLGTREISRKNESAATNPAASTGEKETGGDGSAGDGVASDGAPSDGAPSDGAPSDLGPFDPTHWEPGRVFIRRSVNPVDSITLEGPSPGSDGSPDSEFAAANRQWVCEVRNDELQGGAYVVVSPLGSFDNGDLPVRAKVAERTQLDAEAEAAKSTAATDLVGGEDAS